MTDLHLGVWYHGDYVWINPKTKGLVMLGRSDGTLKPAGVRFGSAEIYNIGKYLPFHILLYDTLLKINRNDRV
jgi:hypothetical protein